MVYDLGLKSFLVTSDAEVIDNPRFFKRGEKQLKRRQRRLSRRKRGSKSRVRAKLLVAKAHLHVKNQRLDHARKLACELFKHYDVVFFEKLNVKGLIQGWLSKSVQDASWRKFIDCLTCKAESAGRLAIGVDPKNTSKMCSQCGTIVEKDLSVRTHSCPSCGLTIDRDHNAALNILNKGARSVRDDLKLMKRLNISNDGLQLRSLT